MPIQRPRPAGEAGDRIDWNLQLGCTVLVWPVSHESGVETEYGEKDPIRGDVVVLNPQDNSGPQKYEDVLIFGAVLVSQLKKFVGCEFDSPVGGVVELGVAKKGKPPIQLNPDAVTDAGWAAAEAWIAANRPKIQRPGGITGQPTAPTFNPAPVITGQPTFPAATAPAPPAFAPPAAQPAQPAAPPQPAAPAAQPATQGAAPDPMTAIAKVKSLRQMGLTDPQITAAVGLTPEALAGVDAAIAAGL